MANHALITGDVRPGAEFQFTAKPSNLAASTFTALVNGKLVVTRCAMNSIPTSRRYAGSCSLARPVQDGRLRDDCRRVESQS